MKRHWNGPGQQFHPWEGGEGKIPKQYVTALLQLAKEHNARGEYARAEELLRQAAGSYPGIWERASFTAPRKTTSIIIWLHAGGTGKGGRSRGMLCNGLHRYFGAGRSHVLQ